mmetsp:Transcript_1092/g.2941  ORF Transcript_1092/g.2941 Transcript_1092/m.2941 type:complete len:668 (-) Transcript_1092:1719-3722(-)
MGADHGVDAGAGQLGGGTGDAQDIEVLIRRGLAAHGSRFEHAAWHVAAQQGVLPDLGAGVPIVLAVQAAVADVEGRCVAGGLLAPELLDIVPDLGERQCVFDGRVAVDHHAHIGLEQRSAFGHHHHVGATCGLQQLLALVPARLVVALHADCALGLLAAQMRQCIVEVVHDGRERRARAVEDGAGGVDPGAQHDAGALHLALGEDRRAEVGWVVQRRHAEGQRRQVDPALLRDQAGVAHRAVPVRVDEARHDGLAAGVDPARVGGNGHVAPDRDDPVAVDEDAAALDHLVALHGHDPSADECELAAGGVAGLLETDLLAAGLALARGAGREQLIAQREMQLLAVTAPVQGRAGVDVELAHRQRVHLGPHGDGLAGLPLHIGQRRHIGVVTLDKAQPLPVRGDAVLAGEIAARHLGLGAVSQVQSDQREALVDLAGAARFREEEFVAAGTELRAAAFFADAFGLAAAVGRDQVEAGVQAVPGAGQAATPDLAVDELLAVRRQAGFQVLARLLDQRGLLARGEVDAADAALCVIAPGHIDQAAAVSRPTRGELEGFGLLGQTARCAMRQVLQVEGSQRRIDDAFTVRRHLGAAQLMHRELGRRHLLRHAQRLAQLARVLHVEGNLGCRALEGVDAPDPALGPDDDFLAAGHPCEAGVNAPHGPDLLQVA